MIPCLIVHCTTSIYSLPRRHFWSNASQLWIFGIGTHLMTYKYIKCCSYATMSPVIINVLNTCNRNTVVPVIPEIWVLLCSHSLSTNRMQPQQTVPTNCHGTYFIGRHSVKNTAVIHISTIIPFFFLCVRKSRSFVWPHVLSNPLSLLQIIEGPNNID